MRDIGFSTGAIALDDFRFALKQLAVFQTHAIELSALRLKELRPLITALPDLDLAQYRYISIHIPSSFAPSEEAGLISLLKDVPSAWTLVLHPNSIHDHELWQPISSRIALENMDRRKNCGRTAKELAACFDLLPDAKFCFDIGHARQYDPSMAETYTLLNTFSDRLVQVHVSEVDAQSRHAAITYAAALAFKEVAHLIPDGIPLILESRISSNGIEAELAKVADLFATNFLEVAVC
ncbi:MAG: TIM barrel protein [Acidobacteriaceae bacterium]